MWKRYIANISRTMITPKKELIVLSTANEVFAVLVAQFDTDKWQAENYINQIRVRVMKSFY